MPANDRDGYNDIGTAMPAARIWVPPPPPAVPAVRRGAIGRRLGYRGAFLLTLAALIAVVASTAIVFDRTIEAYLYGIGGGGSEDKSDWHMGLWPPGSIRYGFLDPSWYNHTDIYALSYDRNVETYGDFAEWRQGAIEPRYAAAAHPAANVSVISTDQYGGYSLDRLLIDGIDAYRAVPERPNGRAVVVVPGAGDGGMRDIMGVPGEHSRWYYHDRIGARLAEAGYTVYAAELLGWGLRQADVGYECVGSDDHYRCAYVPLEAALSSYGISIRDVHTNETAKVVAYAASVHDRLAVATISYGCGPSLDVALASPGHVDAMVMASCWIGPHVLPFNSNVDVVHGMNLRYGGVDPLRALAPLPLYVSYGTQEAPMILYIVERDEVRSMVQEAYDLAGAPDSFVYKVHGAGHKYDEASVVEFLDAVL